MRHHNWDEFRSLLMREATSHDIASRTVLADRLGVGYRRLFEWLYRGVLPNRKNLTMLAEKTGNERYLKLRDF